LSRLYFPSTQQNGQAIWGVLSRLLSHDGLGNGQFPISAERSGEVSSELSGQRSGELADKTSPGVLDRVSKKISGPIPGKVLEVASGSGEHLQFFRSQAPGWVWQGSDPNPEHRASIDAWNPDPPSALDLDVTWPDWPIHSGWDGIVAINLLHISPWQATTALLAGCQRYLKPGGWLYLYGAYFTDQYPTAPSNLAFDQSLRTQNPEWGVRRLQDVTREAEFRGMQRAEVVPMPSHNYSVIFRKA